MKKFILGMMLVVGLVLGSISEASAYATQNIYDGSQNTTYVYGTSYTDALTGILDLYANYWKPNFELNVEGTYKQEKVTWPNKVIWAIENYSNLSHIGLVRPDGDVIIFNLRTNSFTRIKVEYLWKTKMS